MIEVTPAAVPDAMATSDNTRGKVTAIAAIAAIAANAVGPSLPMKTASTML
jgi:hypothetical protein